MPSEVAEARRSAARFVRERWPALRPWLSVALLALLFVLPDAVRDADFKWRSLRVSGDLLALLTLAAASLTMPSWARWVRRGLWAYAILLFAFRVDRMLLGFLMQEEPLLYDQMFLVRHLFVLVQDLWSIRTALVTAGFVLALGALGWCAVRLLGAARLLVGDQRARATWTAVFVAWLLALPASASDVFGLTRRPLVEWLSPALVRNLDVSLRTMAGVKRGLTKSPYPPHLAVSLARKPHVDLYVVESYGRMLWDMASLRKPHFELLRRIEARLKSAGWSMVTGFGTSPVRGGRSWLADASVILGTPIQYEAIFRQVHPRMATQPSLVRFFERNGYETISVGPGNRVRPGIHAENAYAYTRQVEFEDLAYTGPQVGWGIVPDQYSLNWVEEHVVRTAKKPRFMNFHLVTSHSPWRDVPAKVSDWRQLNQAAGKKRKADDTSAKQVLRPLVRYDRANRDIVTQPLKALYVQGYINTVHYDLDLLADLLASAPADDRLVIWFGDHQPPLVAAQDSSDDAPFHVFARDPALLEEFRARGFTPGLRANPNQPPVMGHAGLFSLLSRALSQCCGVPKTSVPAFLPNGYKLFDIEGRDAH